MPLLPVVQSPRPQHRADDHEGQQDHGQRDGPHQGRTSAGGNGLAVGSLVDHGIGRTIRECWEESPHLTGGHQSE